MNQRYTFDHLTSSCTKKNGRDKFVYLDTPTVRFSVKQVSRRFRIFLPGTSSREKKLDDTQL